MKILNTHQRLVVEHHTFTGSHSRSRAGQVCEDEKRLTTHFLAF